MDVSLSFWDVQGYKPVLKRINNGAKLCDELVKMIMERWVFCGDGAVASTVAAVYTCWCPLRRLVLLTPSTLLVLLPQSPRLTRSHMAQMT